MTKEEIEQAAEGYLMLTNHNEGTAIRDAYKAGAKLIQSENERLKAEMDRLKEGIEELKLENKGLYECITELNSNS